MADLVGTSIGQYQILEKLGRGGMATVYKGYQPALERYVAVKVLDPMVSSEELFLARFQREARAVALLRHPHIVQIYDFGHVNDMYYMVMEYVDGQSLRERLKTAITESRLMPVQEVLGIVWSIASALDYAHQRGIVHRDIKPGNILLSSDGQAVLSDFGIAQMITSSRLTLSGLVGTPNYMSPEQGQGLEIDQRTDIYSLGIVTYEMLTNQVPFSSDTPFAVVMAHVTRPLPSLRKSRPDIPPGVEDVLVKATAKEKEQRYYRAMEFAESLEVAFAPVLESVAGYKEGVLFCPRCRAPLEPGQRFCGKCGAHLKIISTTPRAATAKTQVPEPAEFRADTLTSSTSPTSVSRAVSKRVDTRPTRPEAITSDLASSPRAGKSAGWAFVVIALGLLILLAALGAGAMTLLPRQRPSDVIAAQPTATHTQSTAVSATVAASLAGTPSPAASLTTAQTISRPSAAASGATATPSVAPVRSDTPALAEATSLTYATGQRPTVPRATEARPIATSKLIANPTKASRSAPTPTPVLYIGPVSPTTTSLLPVGLSGTTTATPGLVSSAGTPVVQDVRGKILFKTDRQGVEKIYVMNPDGSNPEPLRDVRVYQEAQNRESLSPDGKERLFASDNAGNWDIYMIPADGHKSPMAITSNAADDFDAVWSPTENLIAFVSLRTDGKDKIFIMTPDGRNDRQITFETDALHKHPSWSPDGGRIVFHSDRDGWKQIYVVNKDGTKQTNISNNTFNDWDPIWVK